ncbi:MAG: hypothetical protein M1828_007638 [Chrysothrix sp. TS-e1954]|nr:MAG: hypothetical protein M1828_007638 [Chrysothrix sp. TS-e1954]
MRIAQFQGNLAKMAPLAQKQPEQKPRLFHAPSRSATLDTKSLEMQYSAKKAAEEAAAAPKTPSQADLQSDFQKFTLRIDACLGEWLTPDYYEFITPPPPSRMMVAAAKAELIKPGEPLHGTKLVDPDGVPRSPPHERRSSAFSMKGLGDALTGTRSQKACSNLPKSDQQQDGPQSPLGYVPPTPTYALSTAGSIPTGYVAHARNACVNVDFQWDSMHEPQAWGDGGKYGEEWSAMHRRFRGGLVNLVQWYKSVNPDFDPQDTSQQVNEHDDIDEDTDVVLVIVTHGAGCNALIGALTNQPVLLDVGMASLTMAVHKESLSASVDMPSPTLDKTRTGASTHTRRRSSVSTGLPDEYDMKLVASTDHLRAGTDPLRIPALQTPQVMPTIPQSGSNSPTSEGARTPAEIDRPRPRNAALGSIRRTTAKNTSQSPQSATAYTVSPTSAGGLWGAKPAEIESVHASAPSGDPPPASETVDKTALPTNGTYTQVNMSEAANGDPAPKIMRSGTGLWDAAPKSEGRRRWTVNERR